MRRTFRAKLEAEGPGGAWTYMRIPFDVAEAYGTRARMSVKGTINGFPFRSSILPTGDGGHHMMVNRQMQAGAGARPGDAVRVEMDEDRTPRVVVAPAELRRAFAKSPAAAAAYAALAPSHKKAFAEWIREAKRPETKARRVEKTVEKLLENKRLR